MKLVAPTAPVASTPLAVQHAADFMIFKTPPPPHSHNFTIFQFLVGSLCSYTQTLIITRKKYHQNTHNVVLLSGSSNDSCGKMYLRMLLQIQICQEDFFLLLKYF